MHNNKKKKQDWPKIILWLLTWTIRSQKIQPYWTKKRKFALFHFQTHT